jgi:serine protease AprX
MKLAVAPIAASLALVVAACISPVGPAGLTASADPSRSAAIATPLNYSWGGPTTDLPALAAPVAAWDAQMDLGSLYSVAASTGAQAAWQTTDLAGDAVTGAGVTVAVIDTGISPVVGLNAAGKVIDGPDLSPEGNSTSASFVDTYGHGTNIAGIIAGNDAEFTGIAPDARLLNMKVAAADGAVDVGRVIAAVDWVVAHRNDNGMNVRVINLSSGVSTAGPYTVDPLAAAVESAWDAGIVVVAAAGNEGGTEPLTMPAADPYVIAVGSSDNQGTAAVADDVVSSFSNPGTATRSPDVFAPGKSIVSLRVPSSTVDTEHPEGLVAGDATGRFFRGTGTSQSAAVVSGTVALLLQAKPDLTPDQVKYLLAVSADPMAAQATSTGVGQVNVASALATATPSAVTAEQSWAPAAGSTIAGDTASTSAWHWSAWHWSAWHWSAWHWSAWHWSAWHWSAWHWSAWHWSAWHWSAWHWS